MTTDEVKTLTDAASILERFGYQDEAVRLGVIILSEARS